MLKRRAFGVLLAVGAATLGFAAPAQADISLSVSKSWNPSLVNEQNYFQVSANTTCGSITDYQWDYGDGSAVSTSNSYVYKTWSDPSASSGYPNGYPVRVTVTNSCGNSLSTSFNETIYTDKAPVASFDTSIAATNPCKVYADPANTVDNDATSNGSQTPVSQLDWSWGDGSYSSTNGTSSAATHTYAQPGTYTITLDAYDTAYNWGGTTRTVTCGYTDDTAATYRGTWYTQTGSAFYGGSKHYSTTVGNLARFSFNGTQVLYIASKNTAGGKAAIYIDGVLKTTISLYSATTQEQATVYTSPTLTRGTHTLKMKLTSGKRINVDAFRVTP
jgi:PKD repeat protein